MEAYAKYLTDCGWSQGGAIGLTNGLYGSGGVNDGYARDEYSSQSYGAQSSAGYGYAPYGAPESHERYSPEYQYPGYAACGYGGYGDGYGGYVDGYGVSVSSSCMSKQSGYLVENGPDSAYGNSPYGQTFYPEAPYSPGLSPGALNFAAAAYAPTTPQTPPAFSSEQLATNFPTPGETTEGVMTVDGVGGEDVSTPPCGDTVCEVSLDDAASADETQSTKPDPRQSLSTLCASSLTMTFHKIATSSPNRRGRRGGRGRPRKDTDTHREEMGNMADVSYAASDVTEAAYVS
jgi:hypothetical protein